jgi:hypothetical protein
MEQGMFLTEQGIIFAEQGIFAPELGIGPRINFLTVRRYPTKFPLAQSMSSTGATADGFDRQFGIGRAGDAPFQLIGNVEALCQSPRTRLRLHLDQIRPHGLARPPFHRLPPMFCFFNNAAIAARHAQAAHGAERVAILDFDVHHGNGTQEIFWSDRFVLYASTHQMPLFPGTGARRTRRA